MFDQGDNSFDFSTNQRPSKKESILNEKNLLPQEANSFLLE